MGNFYFFLKGALLFVHEFFVILTRATYFGLVYVKGVLMPVCLDHDFVNGCQVMIPALLGPFAFELSTLCR